MRLPLVWLGPPAAVTCHMTRYDSACIEKVVLDLDRRTIWIVEIKIFTNQFIITLEDEAPFGFFGLAVSFETF
jgi:hypothetical protein